jgi:hypothetical protein
LSALICDAYAKANRAHWSIRSLISHRCTRNQSNNRAEDTRAMEGNGIRSTDGSRRWDAALEPLLGAPTGALWRLHSDAVNATLFARWLPTEACADLLKTDLFERGDGKRGCIRRCPERARRVAALDLAPSVLCGNDAPSGAAGGGGRCPAPLLASDAFDVVVSNSTLDHFDTRDDTRVAARLSSRAASRWPVAADDGQSRQSRRRTAQRPAIGCCIG